MPEALGRKITPSIAAFQERAIKIDRPKYFTPLTESKPKYLWINRLPSQDQLPEAAIFLHNDEPAKITEETKYHLDIHQIVDSSPQPRLSIDFITDRWGNLAGLEKLQFWSGDMLLEYEMDESLGQKAYLKTVMKKDKDGKFQQLDRSAFANLLAHPVIQRIKAVDWTDTVFSYVTGEVYQNAKSLGVQVDAKVVAKDPLISTFEM